MISWRAISGMVNIRRCENPLPFFAQEKSRVFLRQKEPNKLWILNPSQLSAMFLFSLFFCIGFVQIISVGFFPGLQTHCRLNQCRRILFSSQAKDLKLCGPAKSKGRIVLYNFLKGFGAVKSNDGTKNTIYHTQVCPPFYRMMLVHVGDFFVSVYNW